MFYVCVVYTVVKSFTLILHVLLMLAECLWVSPCGTIGGLHDSTSKRLLLTMTITFQFIQGECVGELFTKSCFDDPSLSFCHLLCTSPS